MQVARSCNCSLLRVHASLTWCYLPQRSVVLPHSCECSLLWLPEPQRIAQTLINEQTAQVHTFKGSPPGAVIAKNGKIPAIFSQSFCPKCNALVRYLPRVGSLSLPTKFL